jgi:hypothetical protein
VNSPPAPQARWTAEAGGPSLRWLGGCGEMCTAVREFDWSQTQLGPLTSWPEPLRIAVGICLNSRFPMLVWWGPDLVNVYNDAYIPILWKRHPGALGRSARELWADVWPAIVPQIDAVLNLGEPSWNDRLLLVTHRNGYAESAYFTYSHSPVFDHSGHVAGLICVVSEQTAQVLAERRQAFLVEISDALLALPTAREIADKAVQILGKHLKANRVGYGQVQP